MYLFPSLPPAERFALIMDSFCAAVARRGGMKILAAPLIVLIWRRLRRIKLRFIHYAITPPPPPRPGRQRPPAPPKPKPPIALPRHKAWLLLLVPETAQIAPQLQNFIAQPDVEALLATNPQFARMLRPLCRMLRIPLTPALRAPAPLPEAAPAATLTPQPPPQAAEPPSPRAAWPLTAAPLQATPPPSPRAPPLPT